MVPANPVLRKPQAPKSPLHGREQLRPPRRPQEFFPRKSAKMIDGAVFRCSRSPSAKSMVGQPHVHLPTTFTFAICERYGLASGLQLISSHSSSFRSPSVSGRRSGRMKLDTLGSCRIIAADSQVPINAQTGHVRCWYSRCPVIRLIGS
jgi:hypothetical protein